ncbi:predicted protein [Naegleria gruberi]|uniref:Adenine DNA glycosylase n=1 Tax=Naegleria gruberi TaxID=5762 RepID=D2VUC5_NAEGR|nr:uncharacterized protein NAEGRDRAFT_52318 [Naegleria gruberi]EFC39602.1 predicted protein [Naegleria gruberi]|eukprot:XP_002672346.1 predicted protein [Naegleria gruberi strain NEG-M]
MPPKKSKSVAVVDNENSSSPTKRVSCAKSFLFSHDERGHIWRNLINWYDNNKKDLPWRKTIKSADDEDDDVKATEELHQRAYEVLVSEIMLQQTQVETVKTYFLKWMKRFPTVKDLADATVDDAVGIWSGLGYYRRARYLYNAAKYIVEKINKPIKNEEIISDDEDDDEEKKRIIYKLPDNVKDLMQLPGVGRYTAGAIASIAFSRTASVVDGNVFRVFARLKRIEEDIAVNKTANTVFWPMADNLIQHYRDIEDTVLEKEDLELKHRYNVTGDFNQAVMELGRTVCIPRNPKCTECPLAEVCEANKALEKEEIATVEIYPVKNKKTKKRTQVVSCCIFYKEGDVDSCLFEKRPKETLLGGTWHFPFVIIQDTKAEEEENEEDSEDEEGSKKKKPKKQAKKTKATTKAAASSSESEHFIKLKEFLVKEGFVQDKSIPFEYHASVDHVFTHINQTNHIYSCSDKYLIKDLEDSNSEEDQWKWFANSQRKSQGISTVASKIFKQFKKTFKNQDASPITPPKVRFKTKSPFKSTSAETKEENSESSSSDEEVMKDDEVVRISKQEVKEKVKDEIKQVKMETRLSKRVAKRTSEESANQSANETPSKKKKQTSISSFFKK